MRLLDLNRSEMRQTRLACCDSSPFKKSSEVFARSAFRRREYEFRSRSASPIENCPRVTASPVYTDCSGQCWSPTKSLLDRPSTRVFQTPTGTAAASRAAQILKTLDGSWQEAAAHHPDIGDHCRTGGLYAVRRGGELARIELIRCRPRASPV